MHIHMHDTFVILLQSSPGGGEAIAFRSLKEEALLEQPLMITVIFPLIYTMEPELMASLAACLQPPATTGALLHVPHAWWRVEGTWP